MALQIELHFRKLLIRFSGCKSMRIVLLFFVLLRYIIE